MLRFPLIVWAAFRFDQLEVSAAIAALCAIAIATRSLAAVRSLPASVNASLLLLLAFVSIVAVTGLVLSAVVGERRRAMEALRQAHDELERRVSCEPGSCSRRISPCSNDLVVRSKLEDELRRSEEKFRLLVEGIQDYAIFMLDPEGNVASWNDGAEKIKGYKAEEIIGQHFSRFYPQEAIDAQVSAAGARRSPRRVGRFEDEGWRLRKDGTPFWANVIITALYDASGQLARLRQGHARHDGAQTDRGAGARASAG